MRDQQEYGGVETMYTGELLSLWPCSFPSVCDWIRSKQQDLKFNITVSVAMSLQWTDKGRVMKEWQNILWHLFTSSKDPQRFFPSLREKYEWNLCLFIACYGAK